MKKRVLSVLLVLVMMASLVPAAFAYPAAYSLPALTGNQAEDTANIASSQIGYNDANGGTVFGAWWNEVTNWGYDYTNDGWCSMFACWCANKAGAGYGVAYNNMAANPDNLLNWLINNASYDLSFKTKPCAGDFIFFDYQNNCAAHVAVVTRYDPNSNTVYFVGGNQGGGIGYVSSSSVKWSRTAAWGEQYVLGYGRPNYSTDSKIVTINLNANGGKLNDDSSFELQYGAKCNLSQYSVSRDGYALQAWTLYRPADKKWFVFGVGWCTEAEISAKNYSKAIYSPNLSMELDASWFSGIDTDEVDSFTFYAVWRRDYTVSINANGGKQNVKSFSVRYNTNCVLSPEMVSRSGYVLKGWNLYRPADGTWFVPYHSWCTSDEIQENGYEKSLYSPNLTMNLGSSWVEKAQSNSISEFVFYAVWEKVYQINVDAAGGVVNYKPADLTMGEICNLSPQMVSRNGYTLSYWNLYRPADGKWFVARVGWCTESEIKANGYTKAGYPTDLSMELDSTWFSNGDAPASSFVFYAVWESNCKNGHIYSKSTTPPTCVSQGYTTYTCSCGDSYKSDYTDPLGHNYGSNGVCTRCGEKDPDFKQPNFFSRLLDSIRNILHSLFSWLPFFQ